VLSSNGRNRFLAWCVFVPSKSNPETLTQLADLRLHLHGLQPAFGVLEHRIALSRTIETKKMGADTYVLR